MAERRLITFLCGALAPIVLSATGAATQPAAAIPISPDDRTIVHVLNRLGFGAAPGDLQRVRRIGLAEHIDRQLHPERLADERMAARLAGFPTLTRPTSELAREYFLPALMLRRQQRQAVEPGMPEMSDRPARSPEQIEAIRAERSVLSELSQQRILRAVYSERQLEEVLVDFWFNHFNVFAGKGPARIYLTEYERDVIRPHVLGRFRDLLGATAHSPAMLFYLDNWQSSAPEESRSAGRRAFRARTTVQAQPGRRARGLNENYARELMELHTLGVDGGYTQKDVEEVARAFTGWTIDSPRLGGGFRFERRMHDPGDKVVLGQRIGSGGEDEGERVLDILAAHPSTARFIATKLTRKFVADVPPPALVERASARFLATGGNIREVVRTIVTAPEFFAAAAYRAKVKSPFEFVVTAIRSSGLEMSGAVPAVLALRDLGMPLYGCQPPTGYPDRADAWVNTGALLARMNFAVALAEGRHRPGPIAESPRLQTSDAVIAGSLAGDVSATTRATVAGASTPGQALALVLGSPEFQKR